MKIAAAETIFLPQVIGKLIKFERIHKVKEKVVVMSELWLLHRQLFTRKEVAQTLGKLSIVNFLQAVGVTVGLIKAA